MKPSSIRKVFGIISYFPNNDSAYHIETRRERSRRFRELLFTLEELWPDVDVLVIAQNWQDFELPEIKNHIKVLHYGKLGILGARKELRRRFLDSDYDYLIMLDDDFIIEANDPQTYMNEIDKHPDGFGALKRNPPSPLPFFAISKHIYSQIDMPDIDPEKGEGFEDDVFTAQCFSRFGDKSFIFPEGCVADKSFHYNGPGKCPSSWSREHKYDWDYMRSHTQALVAQYNNSAPLHKVFGVISYLPDNDSDYHVEMRRERSRRCIETMRRIEELWPDIDIMILAQNWQDFSLPELKNKVIIYTYTEKLGILGARKELREKFLASDYDCLIMLDDDARILSADPQAYMAQVDQHSSGFSVIHDYEHGPMTFLSITKDIYQQVMLPDTDPEKGEGFEDDIFLATCRAKFPNHEFKIPDGTIVEHSLRYNGPGKCPSTWSRENKYDWNYMRSFTDSKLYELQHNTAEGESSEVVDPTIDVIISYVNSSDSNWVRDYVRKTKIHSVNPVRFRSWGTLKYLIRGIAKYMPFVRNIVLVVARPSQVPVWVNRDTVRIVYHEDYIPKQFLPTFNSCTIESFFWKIPGLADRVIYFNDDIFPINPMSESDFFTGMVPHIKFNPEEPYGNRDIFRSQCRSGMDMLAKVLDLPKYMPGKVILPYHATTAITRTGLNKIGELCGDLIPATISTLRTTKNINQYIYSYYQYYTNDYIDRSIIYRYFEVKDNNTDDITAEILNNRYQILCLNDSDKIKNFTQIRSKLSGCFAAKFPDKCKYEIT